MATNHLEDADDLDLAKKARELAREADCLRENSSSAERVERNERAKKKLDEAMSEPIETLERVAER